ncbi:hypothetical protein [Bacteroides acidifaciens]|uniref:hypothetical protein n=1 Tax=Bacteroides acidifaciens TaxID=85831 RepID=UPI0025583706|nr:hypothetical protein [Bacteroides acidifaciens]
MKKLFFLLLLATFTSCSKNDIKMLTRYNLPQNIRIDIPSDSMIVIRSSSEFDNRFKGYTDELSKIDFNKYDLAYIQGASPTGIEDFNVQWNVDTTPYELSINIKNNITTQYQIWSLAYLIAKRKNNDVVASVVYDNAIDR